MMNDLNVFSYEYLPWKNIFYNCKQFFRNIKYAWQRATRGYCDQDTWNLDYYLTILLRDSIASLSENLHGYPSTFENDDEWKAYLHKMSRLFDHSIDRSFEDNAYYENEYEKEYSNYLDTCFEEKQIPNSSEISKKYLDRENEIYQLRVKDRKKAFEMLVEHFDDLWD